MATAFQHSVKLDQVEQGLAFLSINIQGPLNATSAKQVVEQVTTRVDALAGRPFGLLFDLRGITDCDEGGADAMQSIEERAADKGLEKIAHLVAQQELVEQSNAAIKEAGGAKLICTFNDEVMARRFASGLA